MDIFALIALAFVPLVACFLLLKLFVSGQKFSYLLISFIVGLVAILPAAFVQLYFRDAKIFNEVTMFNVLITSLLLWGLIEEAVKMIMLNFIPMKKMSLQVFFACTLLAGFTFGSLESVVYLIKHIEKATEIYSATEALKFLGLRMMTTVLIHSTCAGLSGFFIWKWRHKNFSLGPFIFAVLLHGVYNFFAEFPHGFKEFSYIAVLFAILECRIYYKEILQNNISKD